MVDITIEQLKAHFGSTSLITRIKKINPKTREGLLEAYQVDKGELWLYPDGHPVDDILYTFNGETECKKDDWVLVNHYDFVDGPASSGNYPRLKALHAQLLVEVESLHDLLQKSDVPPHRQLSIAIQDVQVVRDKVFILQERLKKERNKIEQDLSKEKEELDSKAVEIENRRQDLEKEQQDLKKERFAFVTERDAYYNYRDTLQKADTILEERLQFYGLTAETAKTGQIQLSDELTMLLLEQKSVYDRVKQTIQHEYDQWQSTLQAQEREIAAREAQLTEHQARLLTQEQAITEREKELAGWKQEVKELQASILAVSKPKIELITTTPIYSFATEEAVVSHIKTYIQACGFYYPERLLENFYTCLKTDYLVILSGISGTGKSKLPQHFAAAIGAEFEIIPVRPHWNDDRDLLGFFNARTKRYHSTRFIEFLLRANEDPSRLYIACLDEMNLAPVEYYFAQLLSVLEHKHAPKLKPPDEALTPIEVSHLKQKAFIKLSRLQSEQSHMKGFAFEAVEHEKSLWRQVITDLEKYQEVPIPPNVRFVGTVNIDHTTHGFSDKVLDRANVIQFEHADLRVKLEPTVVEAKGLTYQQFADYRKDKDLSPEQATRLQSYMGQVREINDILAPSGINIGFRIRNKVEEYMRYVMQSSYFDRAGAAFDFQIKQRILPKIRGMKSRELEQALEELKNLCRAGGYSYSYEKLAGQQRNGREYGGMIQQLENKGYVNYWEI